MATAGKTTKAALPAYLDGGVPTPSFAKTMGRGVATYQPEATVAQVSKEWTSEYDGNFTDYGREVYDRTRATGSDFIHEVGGNLRGSAR